MLSYAPLSHTRIQGIATEFGQLFTGLENDEVSAYLSAGFISDLTNQVNGSSRRYQLESHHDLRKTHGLSGAGALGVILDISLLLADGHEVVVSPFKERKGDYAYVVNGLGKEKKTAFRDWSAFEKGRPVNSSLKANFHGSQLSAAAPAHVAVTLVDHLDPSTAQFAFGHVPTGVIAELADRSAQSTSSYTLNIPLTRDGQIRTLGTVGRALVPHFTTDLGQYRQLLAKHW